MENKKFLTTSEVSKLLKINEKKVYVLAQEGVIPATKVTGKWLFPEEELLSYLKFDALRNLKKGVPYTLLDNDILIGGGSDDPILTKIFSKFYNFSNINIFYTTVGSEKGIELLKNKIVHFSLSHIYDNIEKEFNIPYLKRVFPVDDYVVLNFFYREIGILSKFKIKSINDIYNKKFKFVLRQKGSGIRSLTNHFFENNILNREKLNFYNEEVTTHLEVASIIKENRNFIGIATKSVSQIYGLNFYKLFEERFDLITLKEYFFKKTFQKFYEFILNDLKNLFSNLNGYNFKETGRILI